MVTSEVAFFKDLGVTISFPSPWHRKLNLMLKICNKYDRMKLLTAVIKNENFIYFI